MSFNQKISIIFLSTIMLGLLSTQQVCAQLGMGIRAGGNLSSGHGTAFQSGKKLGYHIGGHLTYHFNKTIALQAEPVYNLIRIRNNEQTAQRDQGIGAGTRKLEYISAPLYLKLNFTERIAIMAGLDFNFLMNDNRYKLNNGENAFRHQPRTGYSLGAEIGGLYFRYRKFNRTTNIVENWTAAIEQYQLGYKFDLF